MAKTKTYFFEDHNDYGWDPHAESVLKNMSRYQSFLNDETSQWLLDVAFFSPDVTRADRSVAREWIAEYWPEKWGYSFADQFNWNEYRKWFVTP